VDHFVKSTVRSCRSAYATKYQQLSSSEPRV
jgi:hypothetical protein